MHENQPMSDAHQIDTEYLARFPISSTVSASNREIEVLVSSTELNGEFRRWAESIGLTPPFVGVLYEDTFVAVVRDAVRFPSGAIGAYLRVVSNPQNPGTTGVAAVCTDVTGRLGLLPIYRHAVRRWSLEIPRGFVGSYESADDAAIREVTEETGLHIFSSHRLGSFCADTGLLASSIAVYAVTLEHQTMNDSATPETTESIRPIQWFDRETYHRHVRDGEIIDGITLAAIECARARGALGSLISP